ncbi:MAG: alanine racemase [Anaerolineae bacterium]|nr:alanine racemase [Anaerolineae bacterium]
MIVDHTVTWAEIDLDAVAHNARQLKRRAGEQAELIAVVKANAYGHGAVAVARAALQAAASRLAVVRTLEGVQLRRAGIEAPILLMGYTLPAEAETIVRWRLTPTVNTWAQAQALSAAATAAGVSLPVHIKADTGMGRFGLLPEEVADFAQALVQLPGLHLEGFYTHFATADAADKTYTRRQFAIYCQLLTRLQDVGISIPLRHVANSAATLDLPEMSLDAVRCGIALYGLRPSAEVEPPVPLRPAMSLKSRVARLRTLPAGSSISYGRTYITTRPTEVALVPVGYGDGYHRLLSNRGAVLIGGQRAPIVGRVCMDQFVVDVSGTAGVQQDDEVVLFGRQGEAEITAEEVAGWAETINYEVTTSILPRVTRVYLRNGDVVGMDPLLEPGEW